MPDIEAIESGRRSNHLRAEICIAPLTSVEGRRLTRRLVSTMRLAIDLSYAAP
jgi:hypothetical protein